MKEYAKAVATQSTAIIIAALGAAAIAFFQSAATQTGICPLTPIAPEEAGALGALFKGIHSALVLNRVTMHT
jgi:hypothetical protein